MKCPITPTEQAIIKAAYAWERSLWKKEYDLHLAVLADKRSKRGGKT